MIYESVPLREVFPHIDATLAAARRPPISSTRLRERPPAPEQLDPETLDDSSVHIDIDIDVELVDEPVSSEIAFPLLKRRSGWRLPVTPPGPAAPPAGRPRPS